MIVGSVAVVRAPSIEWRAPRVEGLVSVMDGARNMSHSLLFVMLIMCFAIALRLKGTGA